MKSEPHFLCGIQVSLFVEIECELDDDADAAEDEEAVEEGQIRINRLQIRLHAAGRSVRRQIQAVDAKLLNPELKGAELVTEEV